MLIKIIYQLYDYTFNLVVILENFISHGSSILRSFVVLILSLSRFHSGVIYEVSNCCLRYNGIFVTKVVRLKTKSRLLSITIDNTNSLILNLLRPYVPKNEFPK